MFGFFTKGSDLPFAIEQIEPCSISRNYKKAVLMLSGINYHTCCELTRFYSIPNTPLNLIGILDKLVGRALRDKGYQWMMTATMPTFAKTKSSTIAGGIDSPILAKHLRFNFLKREDGKYELCVKRKRDKIKNFEIIESQWKMSPVIELIKSIQKGLDMKIEKDQCYYVKN